MVASISDAPQVPNSFANNFWGKDDAGVGPLLERMHHSKVTCEELRFFYGARAALEDEYARKLLQLARKPLGSSESGSLRASLDVIRGEVESIGKQHTVIAQQMKSELEEPLAAFAGGMKERRKIVQIGIEKLLKVKIQQTQTVQKTRDRYEQDCLRIKGYLAQGHMVMGQEERKNKAKLEKTQIQVAASNTDYENAIKALEETTSRWKRDWTAACDKFQDLEEERLDFTKSSLWSFANIASTVCVSDDSSYEKMRVSLENCEVEKDINCFIRDSGTGQEIPGPPKYINFCRGDLNDAGSEASDEDNYTVAQFQRTVNPSYRSSSPNPYTAPEQQQEAAAVQDEQRKPSLTAMSGSQQNAQQPAAHTHVTKLQHQKGFKPVPHNEFPLDGMTMYCRPGPPSELSSAASPLRPASHGSQSEYSNPTSMSSIEPPDPHQSRRPGQMNDYEQENAGQKKRGIFQGHSPFRRKSNKDRQQGGDPNAQRGAPAAANRRTWAPQPAQMPEQDLDRGQNMRQYNASPEPPDDPRSSYKLSVGNNLFVVANVDTRSPQRAPNPSFPAGAHDDPVAAALAELRVTTKQGGTRVSADRYAGIATPAPGQNSRGQYAPQGNPALAAAHRGTPPPQYGNENVKRLGVPDPAFTSAEMKRTQQKYDAQMQSAFGRPVSRQGRSMDQQPNGQGDNYRSRGNSYSQRGQDVIQPADRRQYRATSPCPPRSSSPLPDGQPTQPAYRSLSPNPYAPHNQDPSPTKQEHAHASHQNSPNARPPSSYVNARQQGQAPMMGGTHSRTHSRQPSYNNQAAGGEMALFQGSQGSQGDAGRGRPGSYHEAGRSGAYEGRRRSQAGMPMDGSPGGRGAPEKAVLHYAQAMYVYQAAIPEELSFNKGDTLAIYHLQDDGWWGAQVMRGSAKVGKVGLVPSNYLRAM